MNIIVTGASKGIGFETTLALCKFDVQNLVLIARNENKLKELKSQCLEINSRLNISIIAEDIDSLTKDKKHFLSKITFDSLDVLINNAGYLVKKPLLEIEQDEVFRMLNINTVTPLFLVRMLFDFLKKSPNSHVVNIGSMGGFQGSSKFPGLGFYSASKAALACLTECLAVELSGTNIRTNCLALGAVNTEMLHEAFPGYSAPLNANEMGKFIADFAVNGHKYFNGKIIPVSLSNPK